MMDIIAIIINVFLHLDDNLAILTLNFGFLIYPLLFGIIFAETGLVITPFLPGDSLIFVAGTLAGLKFLNIWLLFGIFLIAAILGDTVNYSIGKFLGPKMFDAEDNWLFKKRYLIRAKEFYDKKGGMTIFLARFVPIVRTFAPFVAGICKMKYSKFIYYNILGGLVWVSFNLFASYFLGGTQFIKDNFNLSILLIMIISCIPLIFDYIKDKIDDRKIKKVTKIQEPKGLNTSVSIK